MEQQGMSFKKAKDEQFFKLYTWLWSDFPDLSLEERVLYSLIRDRIGLSIKNQWHDEAGVYCFYTIDEIQKMLVCSRKVAVRTKKNLVEAGLIFEKRNFSQASKIYVVPLDMISSDFTKVHNGTTKVHNGTTKVHNGTTKVHKRHSNQTEYNHTKYNQTEYNQIEPIDTSSSRNIYIDIEQNKENSAAAEYLEYYQNRIGLLDGYQLQKLEEYRTFDGLEPELIKIAIDKAADNSKRSFGYVNSILKSWAQNGIKTVAQQREEQDKFESKKPNSDKPKFGPRGSKY